MIDRIDNGGPAYQTTDLDGNKTNHGRSTANVGMSSLRDYFAATLDYHSMPTFDSVDTVSKLLGVPIPVGDMEIVDFGFHMQAWLRYKYADAMLAERRKDG